jgi:predicted nucleotide-binding protein
MAILEPSAPRAATLVALDEVVAVEIAEPVLLTLAEEFPRIWRALARVLAGRLRQRGNLVHAKRETPRLFVGSSSEGRDIARGIQAGLDHDPILTTVWTDSVFPPSRQTLEALEAQLSKTDFALLVLSADDIVRSRGKQRSAPRDNVIFELGLFCGALGRGRTFMLMPRGVELKLPSDLFGLTALDFELGAPADLPARLGPVCTSLRTAILNSGTR